MFHALHPGLQIADLRGSTGTLRVAFGATCLYDLLAALLCGQVLCACGLDPIAARLINHVGHCARAGDNANAIESARKRDTDMCLSALSTLGGPSIRVLGLMPLLSITRQTAHICDTIVDAVPAYL